MTPDEVNVSVYMYSSRRARVVCRPQVSIHIFNILCMCMAQSWIYCVYIATSMCVSLVHNQHTIEANLRILQHAHAYVWSDCAHHPCRQASHSYFRCLGCNACSSVARGSTCLTPVTTLSNVRLCLHQRRSTEQQRVKLQPRHNFGIYICISIRTRLYFSCAYFAQAGMTKYLSWHAFFKISQGDKFAQPWQAVFWQYWINNLKWSPSSALTPIRLDPCCRLYTWGMVCVCVSCKQTASWVRIHPLLT